MVGLATLFVAVGAAGAQGPRDTMKIPVFYSVPGTEAVRVEREIVFRTAGDTMLKADIYLPAARGTYPVVLLVSGGSVNDWRTAAFYTSFARVLAAEGIAAVNYDKRLARDRNSVPAASDDSLALADYLKSNAAKYGLDASRLCTWHFSAGGTVAGTMLGEKSPASCVVLTLCHPFPRRRRSGRAAGAAFRSGTGARARRQVSTHAGRARRARREDAERQHRRVRRRRAGEERASVADQLSGRRSRLRNPERHRRDAPGHRAEHRVGEVAPQAVVVSLSEGLSAGLESILRTGPWPRR